MKQICSVYGMLEHKDWGESSVTLTGVRQKCQCIWPWWESASKYYTMGRYI